jgi:hypothetical protein
MIQHDFLSNEEFIERLLSDSVKLVLNDHKIENITNTWEFYEIVQTCLIRNLDQQLINGTLKHQYNIYRDDIMYLSFLPEIKSKVHEIAHKAKNKFFYNALGNFQKCFSEGGALFNIAMGCALFLYQEFEEDVFHNLFHSSENYEAPIDTLKEADKLLLSLVYRIEDMSFYTLTYICNVLNDSENEETATTTQPIPVEKYFSDMKHISLDI